MTRLLMRILFAFCCAAAFSAHAQLTIEIIGGGATTIPIAIVPFAGESNYPLGVSGIVGADLSRSGLFRLVDPGGVVPAAGARRGRALRRLDRARRRCRRRRQHDGAARRPRRGSLHAARCGQAGAARVVQLRGAAGAVPRHRASHRRRHLRKADRRHRRVQHAHRLRRQAGRALRIAGRRRRRLQSAIDRHVEGAAALAGMVARRHAHRLRLAGEPEAGRLRAVADHRRAAAGRQFPRQQQRAGVVARRQQARGDAVQGRQLADLPDQRRRRQCAAPDHLGGHRHRADLRARRPVDIVHLGSRRQPADLSPDA